MDETKLFEKLSEISLCMGILKNQSSEHTKKIEVLFEFYNTSKHLESDFKTRIQTDLVEIKNSIKKNEDANTRSRHTNTQFRDQTVLDIQKLNEFQIKQKTMDAQEDKTKNNTWAIFSFAVMAVIAASSLYVSLFTAPAKTTIEAKLNSK